MTNTISPDELLQELLKHASTRKARSLEVVYTVCKEQYERGSKDFSIPTIARLSKENGGPSEQTIRNETGSNYRAVMSAWATYTDGTLKKPAKIKESSVADEILNRITDPTTRSLVGIILAENRKLKGENSILKQQTKLTIDMRPTNNVPLISSNEITGDTSLCLYPTELEALRDAISDEHIKKQDWKTDAYGRIENKVGREIFKVGFLSAIKKVLKANKVNL